MEKIEFNNACYEVLEILKYIRKEDLLKIPEEEIEILKEYANHKYEFKYDVQKSIKEQNVSKLAKGIIATYFYKYIATPKQREKIRLKQEYDLRKMEEAKKGRYDLENIFRKVNKTDIIIEEKETQIVETKKEKWYAKLFNKIKKFFIKKSKY